jgi:hypothetical protein
MSTHTTYFCDHCNYDRETTRGSDDGSAITYTEYPVGDGWATFEEPYIDSFGHNRRAEVHICAYCLASPEFEPRPRWTIPEWDTESCKNFERGRAHAEAFVRAQETLGTRDRWGWRGVQQALGYQPYGYLVGPKLANGKFEARDAVA